MRWIGAMMLFVPEIGFAQFECEECSWKGNPEAEAKISQRGNWVINIESAMGPEIEKWASSILKAEGKPPRIVPEKEARYPEEHLESVCDYVSWSCMYSPYSAMDRNPKTAWVEGAPGDGIGEVVIVRVDTDKPVKIWARYGKSETTFKNNNRPKQVRVYVLEGKDEGMTEAAWFFSNIKVIAKQEVTLQDLNGYQALKLPEHSIKKGVISLVAIEILSVYPGAKYKDTCISEITN